MKQKDDDSPKFRYDILSCDCTKESKTLNVQQQGKNSEAVV